MINNAESELLLELNFWTAVSTYFAGEEQKALKIFNDTIYVAHLAKSPYISIFVDFINKKTFLQLDNKISNLPKIKYTKFTFPNIIDSNSLSDGTYDIFSTDIFTTGRMISYLRKEQNISQDVLCNGLCSKSKLSKIENDKLIPNISLAEALIQRLGLSDRCFSFWSSFEHKQNNEMAFQLLKNYNITKDKTNDLLSQMEKMLPYDNKIITQSYLSLLAAQCHSSNERLDLLNRSLNLTLPNFDVYNIENFRLSLVELGILGNIAYEYRNISVSRCDLYFTKLIDYIRSTHVDILLQSLILPVILYKYAQVLFSQGNYIKLHNIYPKTKEILMTKTDSLGYFLLYYVLSMFKSPTIEYRSIYEQYAIALENVLGLEHNSLKLASAVNSIQTS